MSEHKTTNDTDETCPCCTLRAGLVARLAGSFDRQEILDELLDAIEEIRAVDVADGEDEVEAIEDAASALVGVVVRLQRIASRDD